jgi:hypothetical protein
MFDDTDTYCVNFQVAVLKNANQPVFRTKDLRTSQHAFCVVHACGSVSEAAAKAVWIEEKVKRGMI